MDLTRCYNWFTTEGRPSLVTTGFTTALYHESFLAQKTVSKDIERLMSVFVLYDSKLNQASKATHVQQIFATQKESPPWELFDANSTLTVWRKQGTHKISLPPIQFSSLLVTNEGNNWLKPHRFLKEGHEKRKKGFWIEWYFNWSYDNFGTDTSDTDTDENENESNDEEDDHIDQNAGISCESAGKDIQEDQCAEKYANHEGRQGS